MYTIKLDVNDTIYDKVMFFLKNIPISNLEVKKSTADTQSKKDDIVSFFHNSPLTENIELAREKELYDERISF
jgi:ethanolamine utilization protein EutA (predicted chaperonin)